MIPHGVEIFLGLQHVDLRWGFDRLAGIAREILGRDPRGGALFVFVGRRKDALKVLFFDGTGMCQFYKRLDRGVFKLPVAHDQQGVVLEIEERALDDLLDGIDVEARSRPPRKRPTH